MDINERTAAKEKIGINIQEAAEIMGISKNLMGELVRIPGFPCIKFKRRIVINRLELPNWFSKNSGRYI